MDAATRDAISWTLGTFLTLCTIGALATKFILFPWLREHLVGPLRETHQQVTENHHASANTPTLPDRLEDLHTDVRTLTRLLDHHVTWSYDEHKRIDRELHNRTTPRRNGGQA